MRSLNIKSSELASLSAGVLARGGALRFEARGGSMAPFIRHGDILTVEPAGNEMRVGDIAFYRRAGNGLVVHRVIGRRMEVGQLWLTMRGDAAPSAAERVSADRVLGRIVSLQRGMKVIHLDSKSQRRLAWLWNRFGFRQFWGLGRIVRQLLVWGLLRFQGIRLYRALPKKLIGEHVRYRAALPGDTAELDRLYGYDRIPGQGTQEPSFTGQMESLEGCGQVLIASVGEHIAGAVIIRHFPGDDSMYPDWWLFGMQVRMRYRGAGIGSRLTRLALSQSLKSGANRLNLTVCEHNLPAIRLYRKMGFRQFSIPSLDEQLAQEKQQGEPGRIILSISLPA